MYKHSASCTTYLSVYVNRVKELFLYTLPFESGCKGTTFIRHNQINIVRIYTF